MNISTLKRQHAEISKQIADIEAELSFEQVATNAFNISLKVSRLAGTINFHLKTEDDFLYPSINSSNNALLRNLGEKLNREIGGIAQSFLSYKNNYNSAVKIKAQPRQFISDTQKIFTALKNRLIMENRDLYPLLE